jgi:serine O-acetyltransferase
MPPSTPTLKADFARYYWYSSGPRIVRVLRCWCAPGLQATAVYRCGQWARQRTLLVRIVADPVYVVLNLMVKIIWGIEVSRLARIGRGLYIGHFGGITVSSLAVIGKNCNLSQGTTVAFPDPANRMAHQ